MSDNKHPNSKFPNSAVDFDPASPEWTSYVLGELDAADRGRLDAILEQSADARRLVAEISQIVGHLTARLQDEPAPTLRDEQREQLACVTAAVDAAAQKQTSSKRRRRLVAGGVFALAACLLAAMLIPSVESSRGSARRSSTRGHGMQGGMASPNTESINREEDGGTTVYDPAIVDDVKARTWGENKPADAIVGDYGTAGFVNQGSAVIVAGESDKSSITLTTNASSTAALGTQNPQRGNLTVSGGSVIVQEESEGQLGIQQPGGTITTANGTAPYFDAHVGGQLNPNYQTLGGHGVAKGRATDYSVAKPGYGYVPPGDKSEKWFAREDKRTQFNRLSVVEPEVLRDLSDGVTHESLSENSTREFENVVDNAFLPSRQNPLSTFSVDVDTASYSIIRRFLTQERHLPPKSAVRIEEMINYFHYDYPQPEGDDPISITTEVARCPWNAEHQLLRVGVKAKELPANKRPQTNLVFLLDVSGSMDQPNKLPLVKQAMKLLVGQLTENDRVAIVVYAGNSGLVLPSITGDHHDKINEAIDHLEAGGSTNGGQGIQLAYEIASQNFRKEGVNRVILATDGDFNVGVTDRGQLIKLIEDQAKSGVFLTALGFGMDNLKDATLEQLADKGNGAYGFIDTFEEAKKMFVEQIGGTLVTMAKDVKLQIEFNPATVASYRLIGYENRVLAAEDFNNDKKDAGDMGSGHTVTALYELALVGSPSSNTAPAQPAVDRLKYQDTTTALQAPATAVAPPATQAPATDPLKYQVAPPAPVAPPQPALTAAAQSGELLTLKLRYKQPDGQTSKLMETTVKPSDKQFAQASPDFKFVASVASFGMILRGSPHKGSSTFDSAIELAQSSHGDDASGYRAQYIELLKQAKSLAGSRE